ncbi:MAG: adenylate kinase family protein [Thermoproteota archaeon]
MSILVITGTPGTGKTLLCKYIVRKIPQWKYVDLGKLAIRSNAIIGYDSRHKTSIVDIGLLRKVLYEHISRSIDKGLTLLIDGHYAPEVSPSKYVDCCIVLRCRPDILWKRLRTLKKYGEEKARTNVESELIDYCYLMAKRYLRNRKIVQIDTTGKSIREVYAEFIKHYNSGFRHEGNRVDWIAFLSEHPQRMRFLYEARPKRK